MSMIRKFFMKQNEKRRTVFFKLLLSFMVLLLLPVIIGGIFFNKIESIMAKNAHQANTAMLEQVRQTVDNRFKEIENFSLQVSHNPNLQKLLYNASSSNYKYIELVKELARYQIPSTLIRDYYVYFLDRDIILSPSMKTDSKLFLTYIDQNESALLNELITKKRTSFHFMDYFPSESSGRDKSFITFLQTLPYGEKTEFNGVLLLRIDEQQIREMLEKIDGINSGSLFIIDENNEVLMSTDGNRMLQFIPPKLRDQEMEFDDNNEQMIISQITSERNNWKYVSIFPKKVVLSQVQILKTWAISLVIVLFVLGIIISYYLANRNYRPIQEVVDTIITKSNQDQFGSENEIEIINQTITELYNEYDKLNKIVLQQTPIVKADFFSRLIRGHIDINTVTKQDLREMDVSFNGDFYSLLLIQIEEFRDYFNNHSEQDWALTRFVIVNICNHLLQDKGLALELEREQIVVIVNHIDDSVNNKKFKTTILNKLRKSIQTYFNVQTSIAVSEIHKGINKISDCYREAVIALDYRFLMGKNSILYFSEIKELNSRYEYHFPIETEMQLMNFTKQGDSVSVKKILNHIFQMNFQSGNITPEIGKCLSFDLLSSWFKLLGNIEHIKREQIIREMRPVKLISESKTMIEFQDNMKYLFYRICEIIKENQTDRSYDMYQRMIDYIEKNFHDQMFSLSTMADHFEMNPSYLSTFFKKHSGQNISDVIAQMRVNESKKMLNDQRLTISEIAQKVGYANSVGLIRVFKKIEGIPPGKYRDLLIN